MIADWYRMLLVGMREKMQSHLEGGAPSEPEERRLRIRSALLEVEQMLRADARACCRETLVATWTPASPVAVRYGRAKRNND